MTSLLFIAPLLLARAEVFTKIINGRDVTNDTTYPFVVGLQDPTPGSGEETIPTNCGASILSTTWILTAAHCLYDSDSSSPLPKSTYNIMVGSTIQTPGGQVVSAGEVNRYVIHPNYNSDTVQNDIALIKLNTPLTLSPSVQPVTLATQTKDLTRNSILTVIGWGNTDGTSGTGSGTFPERLQMTDQSFMPKVDCKERLGSSHTFEGSLCAFDATKDSCTGDSGGPLFTSSGNNHTQYGVVSYGVTDNCAGGQPAIYAEVSCYRNWIGTTTGLNISGDSCGDAYEVSEKMIKYIVVGIIVVVAACLYIAVFFYQRWNKRLQAEANATSETGEDNVTSGTGEANTAFETGQGEPAHSQV